MEEEEKEEEEEEQEEDGRAFLLGEKVADDEDEIKRLVEMEGGREGRREGGREEQTGPH